MPNNQSIAYSEWDSDQQRDNRSIYYAFKNTIQSNSIDNSTKIQTKEN